MATVSSTTTAADASSELQRLDREVKRIQQQLAQKNSGKTVQEFQKDTRDVKFESSATARNIGVLKKDQTRLNVFSSLSSGDASAGTDIGRTISDTLREALGHRPQAVPLR